MPTDYARLHNSRDLEGELKRAHGLLADMYGDPTHFIFELLQNADDALGKRPDGWQGAKTVSFNVGESAVDVAHYGRPFNEADVEGITITLASTKEDDLNSIGKFGVGFKSVFNITNRPQIHSGDENFAIEGFIEPVGIESIPNHDPELTVFRLPLNENGQTNRTDIISRLAELTPSTLLFLRHIEGIAWQGTAAFKGRLSRQTERLDENVRRVNLTRKSAVGEPDADESWIIFSRPVFHEGKPAGHVEIAFQLTQKDSEGIQPLAASPLTVFFLTTEQTRLGFLIQGPYRTTPNRKDVPPADGWNQKLMAETAKLIPDVMRWLKGHRLLDAQTLDGFPIRGFHEEHERYGPLFAATKAALESHALLPCTSGSYHRAAETRLGSTDAIRRLLSPQQLAELYCQSGNLFWIDGRITDDRFQGLRRYIRDELSVADVTPGALIPLLRNGRTFLETQSDEWIVQLYEFLGQQPGLHDSLGDVPILRLEDGRHVTAKGDIPVFLPGKTQGQSLTVRAAVCSTGAALQFLKQLELRERDPVDDVIENPLPKYRTENPNVANYDDDIQLITEAYASVSVSRKEDFVEKLSGAEFIKTVDAGDRSRRFSQPGEVWLATDEQKALFSGVSGVLFVDETYESLLNPTLRDLVMECGARSSDDMAGIVVERILPKYRGTQISVDAATYSSDIKRVLVAYEAIPNQQRFRLLNPLTAARFVRAIDTGSGTKSWRSPGSLYLATEPLRDLFAGVKGVPMVDFNQTCLRSESIGDLLKACGASAVLRRISYDTEFSWQEKREMREKAGCVDSSRGETVEDRTLQGLDALLTILPELDVEERSTKAKLLWESICDLADERYGEDFSGTYRWFYHYRREAKFDSAFVRKLNNTAWIPDSEGELRPPVSVRFDTLGWRTNEIAEMKIRFQPPVVQELAREAGIEEKALDLMQKENLTADDLRELIEIRNQLDQESDTTKGDDDEPTAAIPTGTVSGGNDNDSHTSHSPGGTGAGGSSGSGSTFGGAGTGSSADNSSGGGTWQFHSYVGVHHADESDTDSPEHAARMALEETAIRFILEQEPAWQRTDTNNPGFDLYQVDANGITIRWCEVKAMSGVFDSHPVGMSKRQFEEAQLRGEAYWLYVVEEVAADAPHIVPIQDPAGQARTFTFDKGWREIAED